MHQIESGNGSTNLCNTSLGSEMFVGNKRSHHAPHFKTNGNICCFKNYAYTSACYGQVVTSD